MATRRLLVEIVGNDASLQAALGASAAATSGFGDRLQATGKRISSVGRTLSTHLTLPLVAVGAASGKAAVDFQNSMELLHTQAGVGQKAVAALSKGVLALAGPTATAPDELSAGLYHLASQGLRGKQSLDALKIAAEGAKLGQADLEDVTNALGATIVSKIGGLELRAGDGRAERDRRHRRHADGGSREGDGDGPAGEREDRRRVAERGRWCAGDVR